MATPVILADENIPFAREAFGTLGEVRLKHGRQIAHADLADVDLLIVRSITRVDAALVAGTRVRFVGTATSGSDHVRYGRPRAPRRRVPRGPWLQRQRRLRVHGRRVADASRSSAAKPSPAGASAWSASVTSARSWWRRRAPSAWSPC